MTLFSRRQRLNARPPTKTFIYQLFNRIKTLREKFKQIKEEKPSKVFFFWLVNVVQYGFVISFITITFTGWPGFGKAISLLFATGMLWWVWQELVKETIAATKSE